MNNADNEPIICLWHMYILWYSTRLYGVSSMKAGFFTEISVSIERVWISQSLWATMTFFLHYVRRPLWREDGSVICNAVTKPVTILYCFMWDSPNLEGQVSPRDRVAQLCPQALGSLSVASYDSQGYGGGIAYHVRDVSRALRFVVATGHNTEALECTEWANEWRHHVLLSYD
jgi:hypothetical protein